MTLVEFLDKHFDGLFGLCVVALVVCLINGSKSTVRVIK